MNKPLKTTIDGVKYALDARLTGYVTHGRKSSFIAFISTNLEEGKLFIQFNNGHSTILSGVSETTMDNAVSAVSIGKFYHAELKGKFVNDTEVDYPLITLTG